MCENLKSGRMLRVALLAMLLGMIVIGSSPSANAATGTDAGSATVQHDYAAPPLYFDVPTFVFTLVVFGGFMIIMNGSVWTPIVQGLNAREQRVISAEKDAEIARADVVKLAAELDAKFAEVHQKVAVMLANARAEAEAEKRQITAAAEVESSRIRQNALDAIQRAKLDAVEHLDQAANRQVALATQQVAGRSF